MNREVEIAAGLICIIGAIGLLVIGGLVLKVPERIEYWPLPRDWSPASWTKRTRLTRWRAVVDFATSALLALLLIVLGIDLLR